MPERRHVPRRPLLQRRRRALPTRPRRELRRRILSRGDGMPPRRELRGTAEEGRQHPRLLQDAERRLLRGGRCCGRQIVRPARLHVLRWYRLSAGIQVRRKALHRPAIQRTRLPQRRTLRGGTCLREQRPLLGSRGRGRLRQRYDLSARRERRMQGGRRLHLRALTRCAGRRSAVGRSRCGTCANVAIPLK